MSDIEDVGPKIYDLCGLKCGQSISPVWHISFLLTGLSHLCLAKPSAVAEDAAAYEASPSYSCGPDDVAITGKVHVSMTICPRRLPSPGPSARH